MASTSLPDVAQNFDGTTLPQSSPCCVLNWVAVYRGHIETLPPKLENQMEKTMENEMETRV